MSDDHLVYDKSRFPQIVGKGLCRGCHKPVPKGRQTWCSNACVKKYHPTHVIWAVKARDKGICQICHGDIKEMLAEWAKAKPLSFYQRYPHPNARPEFKGVNYWETPEWKAVREEERAHNRLKPQAEYDHIIPFSEGGKTVLENMRTLCSPCHKERTKKWHKERKANKSQMDLPT